MEGDYFRRRATSHVEDVPAGTVPGRDFSACRVPVWQPQSAGFSELSGIGDIDDDDEYLVRVSVKKRGRVAQRPRVLHAVDAVNGHKADLAGRVAF